MRSIVTPITLASVVGLIVGFLSVMALLPGPPREGIEIRQEEYGDRWPFAMQQVRLRCEGAGAGNASVHQVSRREETRRDAFREGKNHLNSASQHRGATKPVAPPTLSTASTQVSHRTNSSALGADTQITVYARLGFVAITPKARYDFLASRPLVGVSVALIYD
jgi:hypothetical protein